MGLYQWNRKIFKKHYLITNKIRWDVFSFEGKYQFLCDFLVDKEPVELQIEEIVNLVEMLDTFADTFPQDSGFYEMRKKTSNGKKLFNLFPRTYVREISALIGGLIEEFYPNDFVYLGGDRKVISKNMARYCQDENCPRPRGALNSYEEIYHTEALGGIVRGCGS
jgi:hypothetical protein